MNERGRVMIRAPGIGDIEVSGVKRVGDEIQTTPVQTVAVGYYVEFEGFRVSNVLGLAEVRRAREWTLTKRLERIADVLKAQANGGEGLHGDNDHHEMREAGQEIRELVAWAQGERAEVPPLRCGL